MSDAAAPVRFGFLGAGWIAGRALAPAVHAADGAMVQAVAAREVARAEALEPAGRVYPDYAALLADPHVDVVYISLSNDAHLPWTLAALEAGKHVLCEKPLGLDVAEVDRMLDAARTANRLLVEAFWYRWHPRTRRLEELLREGALGPIRSVEAEFSFAGRHDPRMTGNFRLDPARGGGALYDVGCYAVSAVHLALGDDLVVDAALGEPSPQGVDLSAEVRLHAASGPQEGATAIARCGIWEVDRQRLTVTGDAARLDFTAGETFTNRAAPSALTITTPDRAVRVEEFAPVDPYRLMVEAMAARVRGREAFLVTPEHTRQVATTLQTARAQLPGTVWHAGTP
jgi:D-xylose 1-dehydrogenase (NADP+, D-xylono-1,5-lactone-forming)